MSCLSAAVDELLGHNRDDSDHRELDYTDRRVCKFYLCGFCPHDLFINTKADLGACTKLHDDRIALKYRESEDRYNCGYEMDFLSFLEVMTDDLNKHIKRGVERLDKTYKLSEEALQSNDKVKELSEKINSHVKEMEELGNSGKVDEAQKILVKVDALEKEKYLFMTSESGMVNGSMLITDSDRRLEVCLVCGAFLIVNDTPRRINDHITGKMHLGYARIRTTIEELKNNFAKRNEESKSHKRSRSQSRERNNSRDKAHHHTSKLHSRTTTNTTTSSSSSRDRRYSRHSRSKSRDRESNNKSISSRSHRSRSRSKERKRDLGQRHRSKSPGQYTSSISRDYRSRNKSRYETSKNNYSAFYTHVYDDYDDDKNKRDGHHEKSREHNPH